MLKYIPEKTQADIVHYWTKVCEGSFDQDTISNLLMAVREFVAKRSPTREIGDFLAHPKRDRGILLEQYKVNKMLIDGAESTTIILGRTKRIEVTFPSPLLMTTFPRDLGRSLKQIQLSDEGEIDAVIREREYELILCFLGILHFSTLRYDGKSDVTLKAERFLGSSGYESTLSLRAYRGTSMWLMALSDLKAEEWLGTAPHVLTSSARIRAIRGSAGLKLQSF